MGAGSHDLEKSEPNGPSSTRAADEKDYAEFEIGEHRIPWFLWLFFSLIITWAAIAWIPFFGY